MKSYLLASFLLLLLWQYQTALAGVLYKRKSSDPAVVLCEDTQQALPACYNVLISAFKLYPFLSRDNIVNITAFDRPFRFAIPSSLPVVKGNSGNYLTTVTIEDATIQSSGDPSMVGSFVPALMCSYKGTGIANPQLPDEIQAAQSYDFVSCSPDMGLQAGDQLVVRNGPNGGLIRTRVMDGGSQNNLDRVEVRQWLNETGNGCTNNVDGNGVISVCTTSKDGGGCCYSLNLILRT